METAGAASRWVEVMGPAYEAHCAAVEAGVPTFLDEYGAGDPTEFFAVITESFFERPRELRSRHPALYDQLRALYGQDPAARTVP